MAASSSSSCPDRHQLQNLLLGHVPESEVDRLEEHVAHCPRCLQTLPTLEGNDTLVQALRSGVRSGNVAADEVNAPLIARLRQLRHFVDPAGAVTVDDASAASPAFETPLPQKSPPSPDETQELLNFLAPPQGPDELGRLGPHRILKVLGAGGMGVVFEAEDVRLKRPVAIKAIRPVLAASAAARQRFLREAQALAAVKHDHVVTIHQVDEDRGVAFLTMELLAGETLEARLRREGRLPIAEVLRIGREAAEGLAAAHGRGLIHRDVKPGNLWLEAPTGRVKVLDFGLARAMDADVRQTGTGVVLGTPAYLAPEQARGLEVDARCDLFSLGCVLYRLATGEAPFRGSDAMSLLLALVTEVPRPPRALNPDLPPALNDLILRLLAKDPGQRPASAEAVVERLRDIERALATHGTEDVGAARAGHRRRRVQVAVTALVVAAGIVVIIRDQHDRPVANFNVPTNGSVTIKDNAKGETAAKEQVAPIKPVAPPANLENPFVLVRKDGKREAFQHLPSALAVLQDDDAVEVHGNGPFTVPAVQVDGVRVVLKAGAGYRPQLVAALPAQRHNSTWLALRRGAVLEGCDFRASHWYSVVAGAGNWEVRNCRFFVSDVAKFCWHGGPRLRFADCLLFGSSQTNFDLGAKDQVELTNNVIVSAPWPIGVLSFAAPGGQSVRLTNNTMVCFASEGMFVPAPGCTEPIVVEAAGNLLQGGRAVPDLKVPGALRWQGRDNLYVGPDVLRAAGADGQWGQAELAAWHKRWGRSEEGSRQVERVFFRLDALETLPAAEALPLVRAQATRLLKDLPGPAGTVGPDWDLVGPGEAYVRALAADKGKGGPSAPRLDRLRPETLPGGPFVLIRAGQEIRGFVGLQAALLAAQKDDVIEIRTDGPFPGASVPGLARDLALTVRAAPGYRPVVSSQVWFASHQGDLRLEGLSFDEARLVGNFRNLSVRNCAFRVSKAAMNMGFSVFGVGRPVEFRNCVVNGATAAGLDKDRTLLLDNCLTGRIWWTSVEEDQPCAILIRHSAVWSPGPRGTLLGAKTLRHRTAVRAEHSLLVSGGSVSGVWPTATWQGQGNVYSVGGPWFAEGHGHDLEGWRKQYGSDADARELPPLLLDPALWQLLPGPPRTPEGRDYGADVSRVAVTNGGGVAVK